jgi:integrase
MADHRSKAELIGEKIKRRKPSGVWSTDFRVPGFKGRVRKTTETKDKEAAEIIANNLYQKLLTQTLTGKVEREVYTLEEAVTRYTVDHLLLKKTLTADAIASMGYALNAVIEELGPKIKLHEITNNKLDKMIATFKRRGLKGSSINRHWQYLRSVLRKAERGWGAKVPTYPDLIHWQDLKQKESKPRVRFLSPPEAHRLLDEAAPHIKGPIELALITGFRKGNAVDLDWSECHFDEGYIKVAQKGDEKDNPEFIKPINQTILRFLIDHGALDEDGNYKTKGRVFTHNGKPLGSIRKAFQNAVKRAGIKDFTFHDLRHTYASWLLKGGVDLVTIRDALGHKDIKTTSIYANVAEADVLKATDLIGSALANPESQIGHTPVVQIEQAAE